MKHFPLALDAEFLNEALNVGAAEFVGTAVPIKRERVFGEHFPICPPAELTDRDLELRRGFLCREKLVGRRTEVGQGINLLLKAGKNLVCVLGGNDYGVIICEHCRAVC